MPDRVRAGGARHLLVVAPRLAGASSFRCKAAEGSRPKNETRVSSRATTIATAFRNRQLRVEEIPAHNRVERAASTFGAGARAHVPPVARQRYAPDKTARTGFGSGNCSRRRGVARDCVSVLSQPQPAGFSGHRGEPGSGAPLRFGTHRRPGALARSVRADFSALHAVRAAHAGRDATRARALGDDARIRARRGTVPARSPHADPAPRGAPTSRTAGDRALRAAVVRDLARLRHRAVCGAQGHVGPERPGSGSRGALGARCPARRRARRGTPQGIERQSGYRNRSGNS